MNYYDLDGIQTEIKRRIERTKCLIEKWEKVTYPTKKDGAPFKNMSKNFDGATYTAKDNSAELSICGWSEFGVYEHDSIFCHETKYENRQYIPILYDVNQIKEKINNRIDDLKDNLVSLEKQLEVSKKAYTEFQEVYENMRNQLKKLSGCENEKYENTLFHAIYGTIVKPY